MSIGAVQKPMIVEAMGEAMGEVHAINSLKSQR